VPAVLKAMLVGQNRQHALEALVGKFHYLAASLANEMLVVGMSRHRLVAPEAFAEFVSPDQAAFHQEIKGAVDCRQSHPLSSILQLAPNGLDRQMIVGVEDDLSDEIALAGDRLVMFP
jgi:hypothetical protein